MNKTYGKSLGVDPDDAIGERYAEVIETTGMHSVDKTGVLETDPPRLITGRRTDVQRSVVVFYLSEDFSGRGGGGAGLFLYRPLAG